MTTDVQELLELRQWCGHIDKRLVDPVTGYWASSTDPTTWGSQHQALQAMLRFHCDGIGFVFAASDPYCGIDLDHCIVKGVIAIGARVILNRIRTYAELSYSGTGIHLIARARLSGPGRKRDGIEIYDRGRFFVMTGQVVPGFDFTAIPDRQAEVSALYDMLAPIPCTVSTSSSQQPIAAEASDAQILEKACRAHNGQKFLALWRGDWSGYRSTSEADLALCSMLAYWCNGDAARVDRLFRQSGLFRDKWLRPIRAGGPTYGQATVERAVQR